MASAKIVNVVATTSIDQELDFEELRGCREILYDSNVYSGRVAYFKTPQMKGKARALQPPQPG